MPASLTKRLWVPLPNPLSTNQLPCCCAGSQPWMLLLPPLFPSPTVQQPQMLQPGACQLAQLVLVVVHELSIAAARHAPQHPRSPHPYPALRARGHAMRLLCLWLCWLQPHQPRLGFRCLAETACVVVAAAAAAAAAAEVACYVLLTPSTVPACAPGPSCPSTQRCPQIDSDSDCDCDSDCDSFFDCDCARSLTWGLLHRYRHVVELTAMCVGVACHDCCCRSMEHEHPQPQPRPHQHQYQHQHQH